MKTARVQFAIAIILVIIATAFLMYFAYLGFLNYLAVALIQWVALVYFTLTQ